MIWRPVQAVQHERLVQANLWMKLARANQRKRPDVVEQKHVLGVPTLGGVELVSRLGTQYRVGKR